MSFPVRRDLAWLVLILLVAAGLRLHDLGKPSFWLDEAYTWYLTLPSWRDVWGVMLLISDTSPLYYVVARLFVPLLGRGEFALRFVALGAEVTALPVVYRLGRSMFDRATGLWAAGLLALSPFAVWYARDARPYGFYLLFAALALWGFWRWAEQGRGPWLMVGSHATLFLTHYASALFAFAQVGYLLQGLRRNPLLFRRWFGWQVVAALPTGLYVLAFVLRRQRITANTWIPKIGLLDPLQTLLNFLSADADRFTWLCALLALAALGVIALSFLHPGQPHSSARRLLLWWLLLPMLGVWLLSFRLPAYIDRFFFPEIIAFMLLIGAGLAQLSERQAEARWARAAFGVSALALCGGMLFSSVRLYVSSQYTKEDWRGAVQYIQSQFPNAPLLAEDGETLLGLAPYRPGRQTDHQALPENVAAADQHTVVVMRSPHESNHALSKFAPFDPLTESSLAAWFAAHPERVAAVQRFIGVAVVVVKP